jgi:hypothetical protein
MARLRRRLWGTDARSLRGFFEAANREICRLFVLVDCFGAEIEERSLVGQKAASVGMTT